MDPKYWEDQIAKLVKAGIPGVYFVNREPVFPPGTDIARANKILERVEAVEGEGQVSDSFTAPKNKPKPAAKPKPKPRAPAKPVKKK